MLKKFEGVTLWSGDYKKLAQWYMDTFDLKIAQEIDIPEDKAIALSMEDGGELYLWIGFHDKVEGENKDPYRIMISYYVDDVDKVYEVLKGKGAEIVAEPHMSPTGDLKVLTAMDPDRNLIQMFEVV